MLSLEPSSVTVQIPKTVERLLEILERNGYQAYVVGGCVRDSLLGRIPKDWDITTSARPEEVKRIFQDAGYPVLETGMRHGTVTVMAQGESVEVTTFRWTGNTATIAGRNRYALQGSER